jgi:hypothetical protein
VLPLLRKRLRRRLTVALCPTQIAIVEAGRGQRAEATESVVLACEPEENSPAWQAPIKTLHDWLAQNKRAKMDVEVILSDRFVRYATIPWSDQVQTRGEMAALARIQFETLFGEPVMDWEIQADCDAYGKVGVGCAMDKACLAALQELMAVSTLRLTSLQPYFMRAFNRWRHRVNAPEALFAVVEPDHCVFACLKADGWHSVRSFRLSGQAELPLLIEREIVLQGLEEQVAVYLHTAEPLDSMQLGIAREVTVLAFDKPAPALPVALSMALSGEI